MLHKVCRAGGRVQPDNGDWVVVGLIKDGDGIGRIPRSDIARPGIENDDKDSRLGTGNDDGLGIGVDIDPTQLSSREVLALSRIPGPHQP
ncbi:hypothetical protein TIFTF001_022129 [Ficus carica]|uniref:Uncharacterized protein n=1 Tax=Ficus carica TaxID=3494 RepID=A0AA88DBF6_FICCA|nr:hypothetical protein TIFTF001_022129 [Ficus carica]